MAAINVVDLPKDSPFRSADQVPLPKDLEVETQVAE